LSCGAAWDFGSSPRLRTYGELVQRTLQTVDRKRLNADGSEPTIVMHGVTIPRPVHVKSRTDEDFTAEMLSATDILEYHNPEEKLEALRAAVIGAGTKRIARISGVPSSQRQRFVNRKSAPNAATIAKIEVALGRLSA
jgi:DNA-binding phage protein